MKGVAYPAISDSEFWECPIPVPPPEEQRRIVAKVGELLALCDELEARQTAAREHRTRLVRSALDRLATRSRSSRRESALTETKPEKSFSGLTSAATRKEEDDFHRHAAFVLREFPQLTAAPEDVPALRQAILSLAVQGRLVPQNPKDEPATKLLEKVAKEKRQHALDRTGRNWEFDSLRENDMPFPAPSGWKWAHIINGVERVTVGFVGPMKNEYVPDEILFLRSQNVRANRFRPDGLQFISPKFHQKIRKSTLSPSDVVVVRSGNVGVSCVIPDSLKEGNCSDLVVIKRPMAFHPHFLSFYMNSLARFHVEEGKVGVALTHFNTESVAGIPIAVPPLAEQQRIVAKVDSLMRWCDALEAQLTAAQTAATHLFDATLRRILDKMNP